MKRTHLSMAIGLLLGVAASASVHAQSPESEQAQGQGHEDAQRLDNVVVTARRREESIFDVPVSISAFGETELMEKQADCLFGNAPKELPSFALASQFTQAEAKKFFIETARILKPRRMGLIWWNLLDCWPQISDAVVDYYFNKKIAYEYITRSQAPVCLLCAEEKNNCHQVILANDGNQSGWAVYKITNAETGELIASGSAYTEANVNLPLCQIPAAAKGETIFYRLTVDVNGIVAENHYVSFHAPLPWKAAPASELLL